MIGYIVVILFLWFLNAYTTNDMHSKTKAMFAVIETVILWFWASEYYGGFEIFNLEPIKLFLLMFISSWILKDWFLNAFQLKLKGWQIILYGGNNKGDYLSKILWSLFGWFVKWDWINDAWYWTPEKVRMYQDKFNSFQLTVKGISLLITGGLYAI